MFVNYFQNKKTFSKIFILSKKLKKWLNFLKILKKCYIFVKCFAKLRKWLSLLKNLFDNILCNIKRVVMLVVKHFGQLMNNK